MRRHLFPVVLLALSAACVPPDKSLPLGGVSFEIRVRPRAGTLPPFADEWVVRVDRALLSLKTVTVGNTDDEGACAYRGRAERRDVVFDALLGSTQSFNGMIPGACPDVGAVFGPPGAETTPGAAVSGADILDLAGGDPAHALLLATATRDSDRYTVALRFDTARTSSRLAGCRDAERGVTIEPDARSDNAISFDVDAFFRTSPTRGAWLFFTPFAFADADGDHVITMQELDGVSISELLVYSEGYGQGGAITLGGFVRAQFKEAFGFRAVGQCSGKDPGEE